MTKKWTNYTSGQRIETSDAVHTAVDAPIQAIQAISDLILGDDEQRNYVVSGFECSVEGSTLTVNRGVALVGFRRKGEVQHGMVLSGGPAQKTVDISAAQPGDNIYVRFELSEGESENRLFWNPLDADPAETPKNVPTRLVEDWSVAVGSSPGEEWVKIARYAGSQTVLTDWHGRDLLWDPRNTVSGYFWGSDADRTGPIESLKDVIWGLQAQVSSIIGEEDWRSRVTKLLWRDGSKSLLGDLLPDEAGRRSLGSLTAPFKKLFSQAIHLSRGDPESTLSHHTEIVMDNTDEPSKISAYPWMSVPSRPGTRLEVTSEQSIDLKAPEIRVDGVLVPEDDASTVGWSGGRFSEGYFDRLSVGDNGDGVHSSYDGGYSINVHGAERTLVLSSGVVPHRSSIMVRSPGNGVYNHDTGVVDRTPGSIDIASDNVNIIGDVVLGETMSVGSNSGSGIRFMGIVSATLPAVGTGQTSAMVVVHVPFEVTSEDAHEYMVLGHSEGAVIKDVRLLGIYHTNGVAAENTLEFRVDLYSGINLLDDIEFNILLAR